MQKRWRGVFAALLTKRIALLAVALVTRPVGGDPGPKRGLGAWDQFLKPYDGWYEL